jgi:hypothetical protein
MLLSISRKRGGRGQYQPSGIATRCYLEGALWTFDPPSPGVPQKSRRVPSRLAPFPREVECKMACFTRLRISSRMTLLIRLDAQDAVRPFRV